MRDFNCWFNSENGRKAIFRSIVGIDTKYKNKYKSNCPIRRGFFNLISMKQVLGFWKKMH